MAVYAPRVQVAGQSACVRVRPHVLCPCPQARIRHTGLLRRWGPGERVSGNEALWRAYIDNDSRQIRCTSVHVMSGERACATCRQPGRIIANQVEQSKRTGITEAALITNDQHMCRCNLIICICMVCRLIARKKAQQCLARLLLLCVCRTEQAHQEKPIEELVQRVAD